MEDKPFSPFCEKNKQPILRELETHFAHINRVLEVGSGTGQHAVFFAEQLPHLQWQTCDQLAYHEGINAWIDEYSGQNILRPIALCLPDDPLPQLAFDGVFSANTAHIMSKLAVKALMEQISTALPTQGVFCQYGPFIENGQFSSQSNQDFHEKLVREGYGGYRDIDELQNWAPLLELTQVVSMPANNLMLVWKKP